MLQQNHPIRIITRLTLFADKPQNLPASYHMVVYSAVALLLATSIMDTIQTFSQNFQIATIQISVYAAVVWIVLRISGHAARWKQTISSLFGTACFIRCLSYFPIELTWSNVRHDAENLYWVGIVALPFGIWSLAVSAFILKEAMEVSAAKGFFVAFAIAIFTSFLVINVLDMDMFQFSAAQS